MLIDETLIELFDTDIGFKEDILLDSLKRFVMKKIGIFFTLTQIVEAIYVSGYTIYKGMSKVETIDFQNVQLVR